MAKGRRLVALCGSSLFMACVEARLKDMPALDVMLVDVATFNGNGLFQTQTPDVIIFDLDSPEAQYAISLLRRHPDVTLIGLGLNANKVTVLSSQQFAALTADDLTQMINDQDRSRRENFS